uniref:L1 transposable element RRM domain-containing protein n=1 Tax=Oryzias melastigma TaxID=30732 RepID=A0A3B3C801_ORYME
CEGVCKRKSKPDKISTIYFISLKYFKVYLSVPSVPRNRQRCFNMSTKDNSSDGAEKKTQRGTRRQANAEASTAKDVGNVDTSQAGANVTVDFTTMMEDIKKTVAAVVEEKISVISNKLDIIQNTLEGNSQRLNEAETRISTAEDTIASLETRLLDTEKKLAALTNRIDDQEGWNRRDNIRIFGVKEGVEGKDVVSYFEAWLPKLLDMETKKGRLRLDRCHRSSGQPKPGVPRVVIMKLHYPRDKAKVLALAAKRKLLFEGATINIRQDIPQTVLLRRRQFNAACQKLIALGIRFRMQYPAILRFSHNNKNFSFDAAEDAMEGGGLLLITLFADCFPPPPHRAV